MITLCALQLDRPCSAPAGLFIHNKRPCRVTGSRNDYDFFFFLSGFHFSADPIVDGLHRKALDDRSEEYNGVGAAEDDIVGIIRHHTLGAHGKRHR